MTDTAGNAAVDAAAITLARFKAFCPRVPDARAAVFAQALESARASAGLTTPLRVAHFMAQCAHESAGFTVLVESLNYTPAALLATFSRARISQADCERLGRTATQPAQQEAIANLVYGGDWGARNLGNTQPGDGWRFRGRGIKQLTGRANYTSAVQWSGVDVVTNPDAAADPATACVIAAAYWRTRNCNVPADADDVEKVTRLINGGVIGLDQRKVWLAQARKIWAG